MTRLGGKVTRISTVGDNLPDISRTVRESLKRKPTFLITTGGIGPTFDDMTLKGIAKALRLRITLNRVAVGMIRAHYTRRFPGRRITLTKPRLKMASIPSGSIPILNPVGTAPAVQLTAGLTEIFCLPGVPIEAKAIFERTISKAVGTKSSGTVFNEKWLKVQGVMESTLAPIVDRVMRRWRGVYIKSHPRGVEAGGRPIIELHFSAFSAKRQDVKKSLLGAVSDFKEALEGFGAKVTLLNST